MSETSAGNGPPQDGPIPSGFEQAGSQDSALHQGNAARLGRSSALLASGTIISRALGFVRVIILAGAIGQVASAAADSFAIANQIPNSIYTLTVGGLLSAVLVPQIVRAGKHPDGGARYINKVVTLGIIFFAVVTVIAVLAAPALVDLYAQSSETGRGFSPEALSLATTFAYLCLPQIFFYALYSLLSEVLNARNVFGPFAWAPVVNNVVSIGGLITFMVLFGGAQNNSDVEVWGLDRILLLTGAVTIGVAAQAIVVVMFWRRAGLRFRPDFHWRGVGLSATGKATGWLFGMIIVTQLAGIVEARVATLASGSAASVATLQYSWLIFMLPHSVVAVSIATAYFTRMSGHAARNDLTSLRSDLSGALRGIGMVMVFSTVALAVVAYPFARFFEARFDNVQAMGNVILAFLPGLVLFSALFIVQRVFYALGDTRTPFFMQTLQSVIFVVIALACTALPVEWIAVGVAIAATVSGATQAIVSLVLVRRRLGGTGGLHVVTRHLQYLGLALIAGSIGFAVLLLLGGLSADGFAQTGIPQALVSIAVIGTVMALAYLGLLALFRSPELAIVAEPVLRRLAWRKPE